MVDKNLVQALSSKDADTRRKAVTALGKSLDPAALPHLAKVYKQDPDPAIRELARKAGLYIRKNTGDSPAPSSATTATAPAGNAKTSAPSKSDLAAVLEVDLATVRVSGANAERAQAALEQAMTWDVSGEPDQAKLSLQKAFKLDPRLRQDGYARSLTAQIVGAENEDQAIRTLLTTEYKVEKKKSEGGGFLARLFAFLILVGAALMVGGFLLPWLDEPIGTLEAPEVFAYSGLDIFQNRDDIAIQLSMIEMLLNPGSSVLVESRSIPSYSPILTAITGGLQILLGLIMVISGGGKAWYWIQAIAMTIAGGAGLAWLYLTISDLVSLFNELIADFGMGETFAVTDSLGIGFWISAVGVGLAVISAILGLLLAGGND